MKKTRVFSDIGEKPQSVVMKHPAANTARNASSPDEHQPAHVPMPKQNHWPVIVAALASLVWLGVAAYLVNVDRINWVETGITLQGAALLLTGALSPVILIWLIALAFFRRLGLPAAALPPGHVAEQRILSLNENLNQKIDEMNRASDLASERVKTFEERFDTQIKAIYDVAAHAEARTAEIQKTLSNEKGGLEALIAEMDHQSSEIRTMAQNLADTLRKAAEDARTEARAAGQTMSEQAALLASSSRQSISNIQEIGAILTDHTTKLHETSLVAEQAVARVSNSINQQQTVLNGSIDSLTKRAEKLKTETTDAQAALMAQTQRLGKSAKATAASMTNAVSQISEQSEKVTATGSAMNDRLDNIGAKMDRHSNTMRQHLESLEAELAKAETSAAERAQRLDDMARNIATLIEDTLTRMNSRSSELGDSTKEALDALEESARRLDDRVSELRQASVGGAAEMQQAAESLKAELSTSLEETGAAMGHLLDSGSRLKEDQSELIAHYDGTIEKITEISATLEQQLHAVSEAAANAESRAEHSGTILTASAEGLEKASSTAEIAAEAANNRLTMQAECLLKAAADIGKSADELATLTTKFESRVTARSSGQFARTSSFLLEALASQAIDIHRVLETDIPDTVWQKYLKGDRSIFARRAVRLGARPTRDIIARKYRSDGEFREHTERYIKEFEKLMANALAADPQGPLSITLVSSDMGKLYLLLAQSLKRLE